MCIFLGNLKIFIFSLFVFYIVDNDNQQYNKDEFKNKDMFKHRLDEILLTGDEYYKEVGEKKDSLLSNLSNPVWSRA